METRCMEGNEGVVAPSFWCEACKSFHVDPVDEDHWKALQCLRPWHEEAGHG